jgi:hypothetical protein
MEEAPFQIVQSRVCPRGHANGVNSCPTTDALSKGGGQFAGVEHLLKVATIGDATDAPFLRALKAEHGWSESGREGRARVVPFGRWSDTVCRFLEDGYKGLVQLAGKSIEAAEVQRAFVVCALRGVGDTESATLIASLPPFRGCWAGLEQTAIRQIKQRLRRAKGGHG